MFFSNEILTMKGGQFAVVWLVGNFNTVHGSKRIGLKKNDYASVNVVKACNDMMNPRTQFALRLSSTLMTGIIRIYQKQIAIVYDEVKQMWILLKNGSFLRPESVELQETRNETFALTNPLYNYDREIGNKESDIRFYTSLGEKALFEGPSAKEGSYADSAYFTISFGDQQVSSNMDETALLQPEEEHTPVKRRRISKDSYLDILEDENTPQKMRNSLGSLPIQIPGEVEFGQLERDLLDMPPDRLDKDFEELSSLHDFDSGMLVDLSDPSVDDISQLGPLPKPLPIVPEEITEPDVILEETKLVAEEDNTDKETDKQHKELQEIEEVDKENVDPNKDAGKSVEELVMAELSNRINNDPIMQEMQNLVDDDKENRDPNAPRRSSRTAKILQDRAFDKSLADVSLATPPQRNTAPTKRKRKRVVAVDKNNQLSVKEMKKFLKNSRQHLCSDPQLVHKILPTPEELFAAPARPVISRVTELHKLWKRCAHMGEHDLNAILEQQEEIDKELEEAKQDASSRKRPRSSVLSNIELGRNEASSIEAGRFSMSSIADSIEVSNEDIQGIGGFRTSTVLKPTRGSGMEHPMLSPIQQIPELEVSRDLQPIQLLPIMEETSITEPQQQPELSDLHTTLIEPPDVSSDMSRDMSRDDTISGDKSADATTIHVGAVLEPITEEEKQRLECPNTPVVDRLSGQPEVTCQDEPSTTTRYFPSKETEKFYRFVNKRFKNTDEIDFTELVPTSHTSKTAALAFYQLLLLKKYKHVNLQQSQDSYFDNIKISLT